MSTIRVTQVQHEQQECNTSATRPTQVRHKCDTSATQVRHKTNENIFSHPNISYMADERLQGQEQIHSKNCLWNIHFPMPKCI